MSPSARLIGPALPEWDYRTVNAALKAAARSDTSITLLDAHETETVIPLSVLYSAARRVASALLDRGVAKGDRVALILPTGREFLEAFFGIQLAGAVPVALYPPVRLGRMDEYAIATARMLETVQAKAVLTDRRVKLLLGQSIERARPPLGCPTVAELLDTRNEAEVHVDEDALGVIQFSSGSTVDPKPVALTHANLLAQCAALKTLLVEPPGTRHLGVSWLPLYHDMGLIGCLLVAVTFPGPLVLIPPEVFLARPSIWLRAISRHRATVSPAPNFAYGLCLKRVHDSDLQGIDLSHWTYALNGAEPVSHEVMRRFADRFARYGLKREALMPVYGLAEASLALTFTAAQGEKRVLRVDTTTLAATGRISPGTREFASVGVPVAGATIEVRGDDGSVIAEREVGHIWARAPFVMSRYFDQPEATARTLRDGWLDTGDMGFVDQGELFICGRAKDVVIIRGANHSPHEFEDCVGAIDGIRVGCVVAVGFVPSDAEEEQLLILAETTNASASDLLLRVTAAVLEHTGIKPHTVRLLEPGTIPRTSSGKLRRREALRRHLSGTLSPGTEVNTLMITKEIAKSALAFARSRFG